MYYRIPTTNHTLLKKCDRIMAYQMEVQLNLTHFLAPKTVTCSTNVWINDAK